MRLLSLITIILFTSGPAHGSGIKDTVSIAVTGIQAELPRKLDAYERAGYWNAKATIISQPDSLGQVLVVFDRGEPVLVSELHFSPSSPRESGYLKKEVRGKGKDILSTEIGQTRTRLMRLGYTTTPYPLIARDGKGNYHANFRLTRKPALQVDALAAFNRSAAADTLTFFGHLDLSIPNLDGKGKSLRLHWKRMNPESELFDLSYRHPWFWDTPLAIFAGFSREVVNGDYQTLETQFGLEWSLDWDRSLLITFEDHQAVVTYEGRLTHPEWDPRRRQSLGLGYRQLGIDRVDHRGLDILTNLYQELKFEASSISRLAFRAEFQLPLAGEFYIAQRSMGLIQSFDASTTDPSWLEPLGGTESVRGHAEQFVRSSSVVALQHDLNISVGQQSRIFGLVDIGFYRDQNKITHLLGYGVGVQLSSGRGPIRIILATQPELDIQNSFLHIQYAGEVNWIDR